MNSEEVQRRIEIIRAAAGDPEGAHVDEDMLFTDVLEAIAAGTCEDPTECARLALTTSEIDFPRWHA